MRALVALAIAAAAWRGIPDEADIGSLNPVGIWVLGSAAENMVRDISGNANDARVAGTTVATLEGRTGLRFAQAADLVVAKDTATLNPAEFAIEVSLLWDKYEDHRIVHKWASDQPPLGWHLGRTGYGDAIVFWTGDGVHGHDMVCALKPTLHVWHQLVVTYRSETGKALKRVYLDGELLKEATIEGGPIRSPANLIVGGLFTPPVDGVIERVSLYGRALTEAEVQGRYGVFQHGSLLNAARRKATQTVQALEERQRSLAPILQQCPSSPAAKAIRSLVEQAHRVEQDMAGRQALSYAQWSELTPELGKMPGSLYRLEWELKAEALLSQVR